MVRLGGGRFPTLSALRDDILNARHLTDYDLALYIGSIPWPSHAVARLSGVPIALFLHGFVRHELLREVLHGIKLRSKVGSLIALTMFQGAVSLNSVNLYICRSLTSCEANGVFENFVLLPQWVFPEELKEPIPQASRKGVIRIIAYTSHVDSPRLLNVAHLTALVRILKCMVSRRFELVLVDPRGRARSLDSVKVVRPMSRERFLSLLASADLYIERCIDDELGSASLEAMAMGTPVAKLTHPRYWDRQDYGEKDLIVARSFRELAEKIAEYINEIEHYYHYYSKRGKEFVLTKRTWDAVKGPFLAALRHVGRR